MGAVGKTSNSRARGPLSQHPLTTKKLSGRQSSWLFMGETDVLLSAAWELILSIWLEMERSYVGGICVLSLLGTVWLGASWAVGLVTGKTNVVKTGQKI